MRAIAGSIDNPLWQRRCAALSILLLGLFALKAGTEGISNFYAQSAHFEIERWSKPGERLRGDEGARVMRYLAQSMNYAPDNPWPREELGMLQLRGMSAFRDPQLAVAAARGAYTDFRMALKQRPTSPFSWANFALSKLYLGEQDDELFLALGRAEELGPWEPEVQQTVSFVGLTVWDRLTPAQQASVVRAMERGAQHDAAKIAEIARTFNRVDLFCALRYSKFQGRDICSQYSKSRTTPDRQQ